MWYLGLGSNSLRGPIPAQFGGLTALKTLGLESNSLTGSIPPNLGVPNGRREGGGGNSLTTLTLNFNPSLGGSIPPTLCAARNPLQTLKLNNCNFTGTIPAELPNSLTLLDLQHNNLRGVLPAGIATLTQLRALKVSGNKLMQGSIPPGISNLTGLIVLSADDCGLHGSVPPALSLLTELQELSLASNSLVGQLPDTSGMGKLQILALQNNSFTGSIPKYLGFRNYKTLKYLLLSNNRLRGTVGSQVEQLTALQMLLLHDNGFTGQLPAFKLLHSLTNLTVFNNHFEGTLVLPAFGRMQILMAFSNRLSCEIDASGSVVLPGMFPLVLPGNMFSGPLPEALRLGTAGVEFLFDEGLWHTYHKEIAVVLVGPQLLALLVVITAYNSARGDARWPAARRALKEIFMFSPHSIGPLLARQVSFLQIWCYRFLATGSIFSIFVLMPLYYTQAEYYSCGKALLHPTVAYMDNSPALQHACALCACVFAGICSGAIYKLQYLNSDLEQAMLFDKMQSRTGSAVELVPLEGNLWNRLHLVISSQHRAKPPQKQNPLGSAHSRTWWRNCCRLMPGRSDAPAGVSQQGAAGSARFDGCIAAVEASSIQGDGCAATQTAPPPSLQQEVPSDVDAPPGDLLQTPEMRYITEALLLCMWLPTALVLSVPVMVSMLSQSMPPDDNVLGLHHSLLSAADVAGGAMLYLIKSYPIPILAHALTSLAYGDPAPRNTAGRLMMLANFITAILIPTATVLATNQECFGGWLSLWRPCEDPSSFDTSVQGVIGSFSYPSLLFWNQDLRMNVSTRTAYISVSATVTTHAEVCSRKYIADGRCPRSLIGSLGNLYVKDLCFSLGIGPVLNLVRGMKRTRLAKQWIVRTLFCRRGYEPAMHIDRVVTSAVLLIELPLVLGFCVPILPALAAVSLMLSAGVLHLLFTRFGAKVHVTPVAEVTLQYLWISLSLGCALPAWLFWECDFGAKWIMLIGPWLAIAFPIYAWRAAHRSGHPEEDTPHEAFMKRKYTAGGRRWSPLGVDEPLWRPKGAARGHL